MPPGIGFELAAIRIFVHDWAAAVDFYEKTLGMVLSSRTDEYSWASFDVGGFSIGVEALAPDDPEAAELVGRYTGISLRVADIETTHRLLSERGVEFLGAPGRQPWGGILAHFKDPSGNVLTLLESPGADGG